MTPRPRRLRPSSQQRANRILTQTRGAHSARGDVPAARPVQARRRSQQYGAGLSLVQVGDTSTATDAAVAIRSTINTAGSSASDTIAHNFGAAVGVHAQALDDETVAIGPSTTSVGAGTATLGFSAQGYGVNNLSLGAGAQCGTSGTHITSSTAVGVGAATTRDHEVMLGTVTEVVVTPGGLALRDTSGQLWKLLVSTGGALSTIAYP